MPSWESTRPPTPLTATVSFRPSRRIDPAASVAVSASSVWIAGAHCGNVDQADRSTHQQADRPPVNGSVSPINVALAFGSLWVSDLDARSVLRVDPRTRRIIGVLPAGRNSGLADRRTRGDLGSGRHRSRPPHRAAALIPALQARDRRSPLAASQEPVAPSLTPSSRRREARSALEHRTITPRRRLGGRRCPS